MGSATAWRDHREDFIAGGAGYIRSVPAPGLRERGYLVSVADLLRFGNSFPNDVEIIETDIMDLKETDLDVCDTVVFQADLSSDPTAEYFPARNFVDNASASAYLAYIAKRAEEGRCVYAGSCSVYGYTYDELYTEESHAVCSYPYGISRVRGEFGCLQLADEEFFVIGFRQGTICGCRSTMGLDLVVNTMFKCALNEALTTVHNQAARRPILAVRDAATAYVRAIEPSPEVSSIFNLAWGDYTVGEIADSVRDGVRYHFGIDSNLKMLSTRDYRDEKVGTEKAMTVLIFKPRFGVADIVEDLVTNLDRFRDFDNPLYYNIQTFKNFDGNT